MTSPSDACSSTLSCWKVSQEEARLASCEMIVLDELPFKFVEKEGFRKFVACVCPNFNIPSRQTIRADCVRLFAEQRESLKSFFKKKGRGRVSITTDCWTGVNDTNFVCVTAHFIGEDWKLHKKIIGFRKIIGDNGEDIGAAVVDVLTKWDLKSILCCTVDNALANDVAIRHVSKSLDLWNTNVLGGKYVHLRCVAHIINLVVSDGLEEIGVSVRRVREAVKWVKSSSTRSHAFYKFASNHVNDKEKSLCLDVPTRWNSTYFMLEAAEPYAVAFKLYGAMNSDFVNDLSSEKYNDCPLGPPEDGDWVNVRKMIEFLKIFYDFTFLYSGTTYVTSHLFFKEMTSVFEMISDLETSIDEEIKSMAKKMKENIGKYWLETEDLNPKMNKMLYIAAILDPRQKLDHVKTCLTYMYGDARATTLLTLLKEEMRELYAFYKRQQETSIPVASASPSQAQPSSPPSQSQRQLVQSRPRVCSRIITRRTRSDVDYFFEMNIYFSGSQYVEETTGNGDDDYAIDTFDILRWWSTDGLKYRFLSEMAKDILAIPISTIASEFAFTMGGRVLDQFRSSLNPDMVEALICSSNWLRSSPTFMLDEEDVPEEEQQKEFHAVMNSLGIGVQVTSAAPAHP